MSALNLLTTEDVQARSTSSAVLNTNVGSLQFYIDVAENLLSAMALDTTKSGYAINVQYAVLKLTEYLIINDQEELLVAISGPFAEERMGSYSYKLRSLESGWPPMVDKIIKMYRTIGTAAVMVFSTRVFPEFKVDPLTGYRPVHDHRDDEFYPKETSFRPQP